MRRETPSLDKVLPHNLEHERFVIGHVLLTGSLDIPLDPMDFYSEGHRKIVASILKLHENQKSPDMATVIADLRASGDIEVAGGIAYVVSLTDGMPHFKEGLSPQYIDILRQTAALRRLISANNEAMIKAYSEEDFDAIASALLNQVDEINNHLHPSQGPQSIDTLVAETYMEVEEISKAVHEGNRRDLVTGFRELDKMMPGGLKKDEVMIIGGRPGQGKTSLILSLLANMAKQGKAVCFFSIEMGAMRLTMRLLAMESGVPLFKLATGFLNKDDWARVGRAAAAISAWKVWIDDSTGIQISDMRARIRRLKATLDAVFIDYMQIVAVPKHLQMRQDHEKIAHVSTQTKFMNKALGIPVVAAAQLNRQITNRKGGKPQLSDLRQSGQIEQDADIVLLIHREEKDENGAGVAEIIIAKQRNGPTGEVSLAWNGDTNKFSDLWTGDEPGGWE